MAAPKKRTARPTPRRGSPASSETRDQLTVVLEEIRSQLEAFGESLDGVRTDLREFKTETRDRFERIDRRFDRTDTTLEDHGRDIRQLHPAVARIESALGKKVDRQEIETLIARGRR